MKTWPKLSCGCLVLLTMVSTSPLWADDAARDIAMQVNSANRLLRDGNVDEAITAYRQAQESGLHASELAYNLAVAQYRQGDVAAAAQQFRSAAAADNDAIAAKARFNLGNCDYVAGLKLAQRDPPAAVDRLQSAIGHYRAALDIDASDVDARANIELACQLIEQLREQQDPEPQSQQDPSQKEQQLQGQQQQDQQQDSEQQSPEQQDQKQPPGEDQQQDQDGSDQQEDQQQSQQQQQQAEQSQAGQGDQDQNDKAQSEAPKDQDGQTENEQSSQQASDNGQSSQDTEKPAEQEDNDDSNRSRPSRSNQNDKDSTGNQQDSAAPTPETNGDSDQEGKAAPKGSLLAATQSANDDARNGDERVAAEHAMDGTMTAEEAQKMLQSIRDREMLRRLRRQAAERNRHIPVDRDW